MHDDDALISPAALGPDGTRRPSVPLGALPPVFGARDWALRIRVLWLQTRLRGDATCLLAALIVFVTGLSVAVATTRDPSRATDAAICLVPAASLVGLVVDSVVTRRRARHG